MFIILKFRKQLTKSKTAIVKQAEYLEQRFAVEVVHLINNFEANKVLEIISKVSLS